MVVTRTDLPLVMELISAMNDSKPFNMLPTFHLICAFMARREGLAAACGQKAGTRAM